MSVFSIILGLVASVFTVNGAGNLKGTWNKPVESYTGSSFFSPEIKKGLDVTDKFAKTAGPALIAIQSFTSDAVKTAALQSVIDVTSGKLPKSGDQLSKTISNVGDEFKTNFGSKKSNKINESGSISNIPPSDNFTAEEKTDLSSSNSPSVITQSPSSHYIDNEKQGYSPSAATNDETNPESYNAENPPANSSDAFGAQSETNVNLIET